MTRPFSRRLAAQFRYLAALLGRFRVTFLLAALLLLVAPLLFWQLYRHPDGTGISYGEAFYHVYFLMVGQLTLPYTDNWLIDSLDMLILPMGLLIIVDGVVRFAYLFFARHRSDKEWIAVLSQTLREHVVICGAGRVGYRVAEQLLAMDREIVVIEKREDALFTSILRDRSVPVLIDDVKSPLALTRTNIGTAAAIVCATDDDLSNLNAALDARRLNPKIRVVIRLFDDDLVAKVRDTFDAEALSTSALAAPAVALAALDPRILHSFRVGGQLLVVSEFLVRPELTDRTVAEVRDRFGGLTLSLRRAEGGEHHHPKGETRLAAGDVLVVQAAYPDYMKLREFTNEAEPPRFHPR